MRRVVAIAAFFAGAKIQKSAPFSWGIWPLKLGVGADCHPRGKGRGTNLTPSCWHVKKRDVRLQEGRAKCYVVVPGDWPIEGGEINSCFRGINHGVVAVD